MSYILTTNLGLVAVRDEVPSAYDWSATYWNWINADKILYALLNHGHTGTAAQANPDTAPGLTTAATGGTLPAGITYFGVVSYTDASGRETAKSAAGTVTTAAAIAAPATPTHNFQATPTDLVADNSATPVGLLGGNYWYKLTYVKGGGETTASSPVAVVVPTDTLYSATIHFTSLNDAANGADKIFIYRKSGTGNYVKMIEISAGATDSYTDNNTAVVNCDKQPPATNTTNSFNTVTFDWTGLNYVDAEYINLYITTTGTIDTPTFTSNTHKIVPVDMATPVTSYVWAGEALVSGKPLSTSQSFQSPPKINLATEVTGYLPVANLPEDISWEIPVATAGSLPSTTVNGEVRLVEDTGKLYRYDTSLATPAWDEITSGVELVQLDALFDIQNTWDTNVLPYMPNNPSDGQIVAVRNSNATWGIYPNLVYLYMWRNDWATPAWQLINPTLNTIESGGYTNFSAPKGTMWLEKRGGTYDLRVMQPSGTASEIPTRIGGVGSISDSIGYMGESEDAFTWYDAETGSYTSAPSYGYGAITFYWNDKSFYYYDDNIATPAWIQVPSVAAYGQVSALNQTAAATPLTQVDFTISGASRFLVTKIAIECTDGQATPVIDYDIELYEDAGRTTLAYQAQNIMTTTYTDRSPWEYFGTGDIYARLINNTSSAITDFDITIDYRV